MKCSVDGCERKSLARGLCSAHYTQYNRGQLLTDLKKAHGQIEDEPYVLLPGVRVSRRIKNLLKQRGPTISQALRAVLEEWAKSSAKND